MSLLDDVRSDLAAKLQVTHTITTKAGTQINVGEKFTARFRVQNIDPVVSFKNVKLQVSQTPNATPVKGSPQLFDLVPQIGPGQAVFVSVEFTATRTLDRIVITDQGKPIQLILMEPFAALEIRADADLATLGNGIVRSTVATEDIRA